MQGASPEFFKNFGCTLLQINGRSRIYFKKFHTKQEFSRFHYQPIRKQGLLQPPREKINN
jgi:hypothetical protein